MVGEEEDIPLVFGSNICGTQQTYLGFSEQDLNGLRTLSSLDAKKIKAQKKKLFHLPLFFHFLFLLIYV